MFWKILPLAMETVTVIAVLCKAKRQIIVIGDACLKT